ncbi:Autophagy-related protein 22-like protein [Kalmanozyma brasiliensis GHG001]|uniref:Autophagy-related protein n=1 Tax=Kalmanozyma brasiliensis (strain GHG001) TaxID=1365824 RepID=V5E4X1_KALBG|nr:Autophagy-related protein 22-like protein [Kalmanozyma brasiliensis GHG001]EST05261.1 Autophagy-related protein 22-like protein [Kalmanozyma brasiliensis GHG001]
MADTVKPAPEPHAPSLHERDQISLEHESDAISEVSTNKNFATALLTNSSDATATHARYITGRKELWTYYLYYVGQCGLSLFNFAPTQFQNLLSQEATNLGAGTCGGDDQPECRLLFAGKERTIESIVLLSNGISFAIQAALFIAIGSTADYGKNRPLILIVSTALSIGLSLGWLGVTTPEKWQVATGMYMVGLIAYQLCQTYWTAAFPGLARDLPHMREARQRLIEDSNIAATTETKDVDDKATTPAVENITESVSGTNDEGRMTADKYSLLETMAINRISNIAFTVCSVGELVVLAVIQGMLYGIHADRDTQSNTTALSAIVAFGGGVQILCSIPYFLAMRWRPGQPLPPGTNYLTAAVKQAFLAAKHLRHLRQTLIYLIFYFLFSDALNTTVTVISTLQYATTSYSATTSNILLIVGIAAQAVGIYTFWLIQKRFQLSTFTMFCAVIFFTLLLQVWGFIGIFTQRFGFHNEWEFYVYQAYYGLVVCPWYAYGQTMIAEVTPKGTEFLFFSLFSIVGKGSSFIAPFITQAIADDTGNASTPFYFLLALSAASCVLLWPLDLKKSKIEQALFIQREAEEKGLAKSDIVTPQTVAQVSSHNA